MPRFDVYANPIAPERSHTPFVLDVQIDHLGPLATCVVIPLRSPRRFGTPAAGLNPQLEVDGRAVVADTAALAPVPVALLKKTAGRITGAARDDVLDALDTLFGGY